MPCARPPPVRRLLVRRLLVAVAALALLGSGGAAARRAAGAGRSAAVAAIRGRRPVGCAADRVERDARQRPGGRRAGGLLASVPAPTGSGDGLRPGSGPLVAPHLVARPQSRPPTDGPVGAATGAPGSRAPPAAAGT